MFGSVSSDVAQDRDGAVLAGYLSVIGLFYLYSLTGVQSYLVVGTSGIFVAPFFDALVNDIAEEIDAPRLGEDTVTNDDLDEVVEKLEDRVGIALILFMLTIILSFAIFVYSLVGYLRNVSDSVAALLLVVQSLMFVKYAAKMIVIRKVRWGENTTQEPSQATLDEFD